MNFTSSHFLLFILVVLVLYAVVHPFRRLHKLENAILCASSLFFYGFWDHRYLFLILISCGFDYLCALAIARPAVAPRRIAGTFSFLVASCVVLCAPIDWLGLRTLVLPPAAFSGGWVDPAPFQGLFKAGGNWQLFWGGFAGIAVLACAFMAGLRLTGQRRRKTYLVYTMVSNLGILCFFKYFDFFVASAAGALETLGLGSHDWQLGIIVPVGISFYTFQTMSYTIDVYRGELDATESFLDFSTFVAFFPQLVAGPIERARALLPQIERWRPVDWDRIQVGTYLIVWGFFKKLFIADNLAALVQGGYAAGARPDGPDVLLATYAFAFQIYCDFSAYSDIARGLGRLFNVELMVNFNIPYAATNPREFWRRWHISLSTWLRDYLFIPLGGSRGSALFAYRNLMLTMVLGGLWHGARANFVLWGLYQGALLCAHRALEPTLRRLEPRGSFQLLWRAFCWIAFFHLVCYGWLLFRAETGRQILDMTTALGTGWADAGSRAGVLARIAWFTWPMILIEIVQYRGRNLLAPLEWSWPVRTAFYALIFYLTAIFGEFGDVAFIYFQF